MNAERREAHFPGRAPIDAYGSGGFRFARMSHRGSILALPSGIYAWEPRSVAAIGEASFARVIQERAEIDLLVIGTGRDLVLPAEAARNGLREAGVRFEALPTAGAASTYNVLLAEGRRVAAALIAVD